MTGMGGIRHAHSISAEPSHKRLQIIYGNNPLHTDHVEECVKKLLLYMYQNIISYI